MADVFAVLSDPTRREMLLLLRDGDMTAGAIGEHFDMTAPSVSHHLGVLKESGLVMAERKGRTIVYSLNTTVVQDALAWMLDVFGDKERDPR